ncbi:hypothetical protein FAVG1_00668 [Fusarium avenaceum]|nr:hypothetical protein FAVG1_00668 [Fusarium avenaceum]
MEKLFKMNARLVEETSAKSRAGVGSNASTSKEHTSRVENEDRSYLSVDGGDDYEDEDDRGHTLPEERRRGLSDRQDHHGRMLVGSNVILFRHHLNQAASRHRVLVVVARVALVVPEHRAWRNYDRDISERFPALRPETSGRVKPYSSKTSASLQLHASKRFWSIDERS